MQKKIVVLGCGLVGATMARDLAADADLAVTAVDFSPTHLDQLKTVPAIACRQADLSTPKNVAELVADYDVVVGAMPSALGFMVMRAVIEASKPFADISFFIEDAMQLGELARARGVTVVFDCGVAPGLANLIIGHCQAQLERVERVVYYVGGLPKDPAPPFYYKAPFAPADVLEEYTRPVRMIEGGRAVTKPALSESEIVELPNAGRLEGFNTDGLRSLLTTVAAPDMVEKTLRYPGHRALMQIFRDTGLFRKDEIDVRGVKVRPLDVTSQLLFPLWTYEPGEEEFTVLRVVVEGPKGGRRTRLTYDLYDEYDKESGCSSMARTTGFPCAIFARMLARKQLHKPGVYPPEVFGREDAVLPRMIEELKRRGVHVTSNEEALT